MAEKKKPSDYKGLSKAEAIRQFKREVNARKQSFSDKSPEWKRMQAAEGKLVSKKINHDDYYVTGEKHREGLTHRDPDIAEYAKASTAWNNSVPLDADEAALKEAHGVTDKEIRRWRFEAQDPEFTDDAPDAAPAAAEKKKPSLESVKGLQRTLTAQGYYYGDITGQEDEATKSAILRFQIRNNLKKTSSAADLLDHWTSAPQGGGPAQPQAAAPAAAAPAAPAAAPQDDRVRGPESRVTGRNEPVIPVPPPAPVPPAAAAVPDVPQEPAEGGNAAKIGSVVAGAVKAASEGPIRKAKAAKEAIDQKKLDARTAKEKQSEDNDGKPKWTKYEEAKAKYEVRHGRPPPPNWISSASQTELADQATIPQAMRDLGVYSTYSGDTDPKTGLTKPEVWDKLFKGSGKQDEGWTEVDGGRVSADGRFQMPFGDKGRWGDVTAPMSLTLDRHFGGKDWLTKKAWSSATPDEQASMIRADAGIPTPQVWVTPTDTAAEVGADIAALDGTSVDRRTGLPVPAGARMVSGQRGSGFTTTKLPAAPPAQGAGNQSAGQLPSVDPETKTIIDNAVKATHTKS